MATFHANVGLYTAAGAYQAAGSEFDIPVDGSNVPTLPDDKANLNEGRMYLVTGGPGPTPAPAWRGVDIEINSGKLVRDDTRAVILDPLAVADGGQVDISTIDGGTPSSTYSAGVGPGGSVDYVGQAVNTTITTSTSLSLTRPSGTASGDIILAQIYVGNTAGDIIVPAGWTLVDSQQTGASFRAIWLWRRDDGSAGPWTVSIVDADGAALSAPHVHATSSWRGAVSTGSPIDVVAKTTPSADSTSFQIPYVSPTATSRTIVVLPLWNNGSGAQTWPDGFTPPTALTSRVGIAYRKLTSSSPTGVVYGATANAVRPATIVIALKQEPTASASNGYLVNPDNLAAAGEAAARAAGRLDDAKLLHKAATQPISYWLGYSDDATRLQALIDAARTQGKALDLAIYYIPYRDNGQYSGGGAQGRAAYKAKIDLIAGILGSYPARLIIEPDALSFSSVPGSAVDDTSMSPTMDPLTARLWCVQYAAQTLKALANKKVYIDAGNRAFSTNHYQRVAPRLLDCGVDTVDGFALNVSNFRSTDECVAFAGEINSYLLAPSGNSALTGSPRVAIGAAAHFIINTDRNGAGPLKAGVTTTHPVTGYAFTPSDNRDYTINPPNMALGSFPTNTTGITGCDAFMWAHDPSRSDGAWNPRTHTDQGSVDYNAGRAPNSGSYYEAQLLDMARHPNSPNVTAAGAAILIQPRRGTPAAWAAANPVLGEGELGISDPGKTTQVVKIGDGQTPFASLPGLLDSAAPLASPALTGTPTAPTASAGTNTTQVSTTAFVKTAIDNLVNGAPGALDTLKEIADQLASDESAAAALTGLVATKASAASLDIVVGKLAYKTPADFGGVPAVTVRNATISNGSTTVNGTGFTPSMNGQLFYMRRAGAAQVTGAFAWENRPLFGTFTYVSATQGTLSVAAAADATADIRIGADATAALQAAIDYGYCFLPDNQDWMIAGQVSAPGYSKTILRGAGERSRLFLVTDKLNGPIFAWCDTVAAQSYAVWGNGGGSQPTNSQPASAAAVVAALANAGCGTTFAACKNSLMSGVSHYHCGGTGVGANTNGIAGAYDTMGNQDCIFENLTSKWCRNGFNCDAFLGDGDPATFAPQRNSYRNIKASFCRFGVAWESGQNAQGLHASDVFAYGCSQTGIEIHDTQSLVVVNPRGISNQLYNLNIYGNSSLLNSHEVQVVNPYSYGAGVHGIRIGDQAHDCLIIGGISERSAGAGLAFSNVAHDNRVIDLHLRLNAQGGPQAEVVFNNSSNNYVRVKMDQAATGWVHTYAIAEQNSSGSNTIADDSQLIAGTLGVCGYVAGAPASPSDVTPGSAFTTRVGSSTRRERNKHTAMGIKGETASRYRMSGSYVPPSGEQRAVLVGLSKGESVRGIYLGVINAASNLTLLKVGVWSKTGTLLASSADLSSQFGSGAGGHVRGGALSSIFVAPDDDAYYIGFVSVGSGGPQVLRDTASGVTNFPAESISGAVEGVSGSGFSDIGNFASVASGTSTTPWLAWN